MEKAHALLSPSGAPRWMVCIGSVGMQKGMPDTPSEYSDEGTCAHAVAKMAWDEQKDAAAYIGRRIEIRPLETMEVTEEMADDLQPYLDICKALALNGDARAEVNVPIGHITGEEGAEGTADFVVIDVKEKELICADLKFGMGVPVFAKDNEQLLMYLLGVYDELSLVYDIERVRGIISQPRLNNTSEETWTIAQLEEFRQRAKEKSAMAWEASNETDPVKLEKWLCAGSHCKFCKAAGGNAMFPGGCPALAKRVQKEIGADFGVIAEAAKTYEKGHDLSDVMPPPVDDQLGTVMDSIDLIEMFTKAVRSRVESLLLQGVPVPSPSGGYKLVQGRKGNRKWESEESATKALKGFRLKDEEMYEYKLISPTTAEKLLKSQPKRWTKLEKLITQADGGKSVAPMSDKRPAFIVEAPSAEDFDPIDTGDDLI